MLGLIYKDEYSKSSAQQNVSSIAFAGTVVGQLAFGYLSDTWSRKKALLLSTVILIIFAALGAGSYGAGGSISGLFSALTAFRFLLGIGYVLPILLLGTVRRITTLLKAGTAHETVCVH